MSHLPTHPYIICQLRLHRKTIDRTQLSTKPIFSTTATLQDTVKLLAFNSDLRGHLPRYSIRPRPKLVITPISHKKANQAVTKISYLVSDFARMALRSVAHQTSSFIHVGSQIIASILSSIYLTDATRATLHVHAHPFSGGFTDIKETSRKREREKYMS